ncbi:two-component sensor histidine kinase [Myxacorys almedinensis A]|uniref:histidine kinase n=2 Tax=Myxacorys TaxID=2056239 RepID=A0A8J8CKJ8_9CYAN|nr:two-component sensor histidine kinase [Myxacorys almedinensis A]
MFNRSRRNLARWFTLSMGGILVGFAGVLYYQATVEQLKQVDQLLYRKARVMAASVKYEPCGDCQHLNLNNVPFFGNGSPPLDSGIVYARWYNAQRRIQRFFGTLPTVDQLDDSPEFQTVQIEPGQPAQRLLRQITLPVYLRGELIGYLQIALPLAEMQDELQRFLLSLTLWVLLTITLISLAGWGLGGIAMQPIREAYDYLDRFTADASHELRAPLAAILSNAQVGLIAPLEAGQPKHYRLEKIAVVAKSMTVLISNLLFLARRTGHLATESLQSVDLTELLHQLLHAPTLQTAAQQVTLEPVLPEQAVTIQADPALLTQAIANLIHNACKFTPEQGLVQVRLFTQSRWALIQIQDSGRGIPAEDLPHISERFYRVNKARSREAGGSGLGLAIAQHIITAHGGSINVHSEVDRGTVFQITLPLS